MAKEFYLGLVITALMTLVGHWFPNPRRFPTQETGRFVAYTYGVLSMLAGEGIWLFSAHQPVDGGTAWYGLLAYASVAGVATMAAYGIDMVANLMVRIDIFGVTNDGDNGSGARG
jgi:hypothetical protein